VRESAYVNDIVPVSMAKIRNRIVKPSFVE
jgi:hypothetical protein